MSDLKTIFQGVQDELVSLNHSSKEQAIMMKELVSMVHEMRQDFHGELKRQDMVLEGHNERIRSLEKRVFG